MNARFGGALALSLILAACGEKQNNGLENRQDPMAVPAASPAGDVHSGTGQVKAIAGDQVTISHGPIQGLGWPAMTMTFRAASPEMVQGLNVGDRVSFAFRQEGSAYALTSLSRAG